MKTYTISQVAEQFSLKTHTLRFYESEGLLKAERTEAGVRRYTEENLRQLETVLCLKGTGMPLKDIRRYFQLVEEGSGTLEERLEIILAQRERVLAEINALQKNLKTIEHKVNWYRELCAEAGLTGKNMNKM